MPVYIPVNIAPRSGDFDPLEPDMNFRVYRYHSENRPCLDFALTAKESNPNQKWPLLFMGIELEFDTSDTAFGRLINKHHLIDRSNHIWGTDNYIYYMRDSSLRNGMEMITQPATWNFHVENREKYRETFENILSHGFKTAHFQTCGLHIHFNRDYYDDSDSDLCIMRLLYIVERFWPELVLMSRRNYNRLERWAGKYEQSPKEVLEWSKRRLSHNDRYKAINLTNSQTIEFRMYRSTLDLDDFFAILELTKNIIEASKTLDPNKPFDFSFENLVNTSANLMRYYRRCIRQNYVNRLPQQIKDDYERRKQNEKEEQKESSNPH